jgi:hypothetical protein
MKPNVKALAGKPKGAKKTSYAKSAGKKRKSTSNRADSRKRASVYGKWAKGNL